jgi:hypothetical protein
MDPDVHFRLSIAGMFCGPSIFPVTPIFPAVSTARKNTAGSRE